MLQKLLGVNWQTTLAGLGVIFGLIVKIIAAIKVKDFASVLTDVKELVPDIMALAIALGLIAAKDGGVTGTGSGAARPS